MEKIRILKKMNVNSMGRDRKIYLSKPLTLGPSPPPLLVSSISWSQGGNEGFSV